MRTWPFAGREAEQAQLRRAVRDPRCRGLLIAGEPGVGKTRLGMQGLELAAEAGLATERVMATAATTALPLGAVTMLLPTGFGEMPGVRDQADLIRRAVAALVGRAGGDRLALLVDDAHLLDNTSAVLIHQLALTNQAFLILTLRSRHPAPGPVVELWKQDLLRRLDLGVVAEGVIAEIVAGYLGGPVATALTDALIHRSGGNLLFVRELVLGALAEGAIRPDAGLWTLHGRLHPSARLIELIEARICTITPAERAFLEMLALSEPLREPELDTLTTPEVLESLERQALIVTTMANDRFSAAFAHPLHAEALRATLTNSQVRRIARHVVEVLESRPAQSGDDQLRIASLRLLCGGGSPALLLSAARLAKQRFDFGLTTRLARASAEVGGGLQARLLQAEATALSGRREEAEDQFGILHAGAEDGDERARVALLRLYNTHHLARPYDNLRIVDEALASATEPALRAALSAVRTWMVMLIEGPGPCLTALDSIDEHGCPAQVSTYLVRAFALAHAGRTREAIKSTELGKAVHATQSENFYLPAVSQDFYRCTALIGSGRLAESEVVAMSAYQSTIADGLTHAQAMAAYPLALTYLEQGHVARAIHYARESVALCHQTSDFLVGGQPLLLLAQACALSGDTAGAVDTMAEFDALGLPPIWHWTGLFQTRAWIAAATGDLPSAVALLERECAVAEANGDLLRLGAALHTIVRIGRPATAEARLLALSERVEGDLARLRACHAVAAAGQDGAELETVSAGFEAIGAHLLAAETAVDAAMAWRRAKSVRQATSAQHRAARLLDLCEGASTPAIRSINSRALLTPAERDTAVLAAEGRTNKEIAQVQSIAVRTVESRLQNIYAKLGISSRNDIHDSLYA